MSTIEEQIIQAIKKSKTPIKYRNDALSFLYQSIDGKDHTDRLLSWFIVFRLIKPEPQSIPIHTANLYQNYQAIQKELFQDKDPLDCLDEKDKFLIISDTQRSSLWFTTNSQKLGLTEKDFHNHTIHVPRILATLTKSDSFYSYTQGYDRYAFITYALSLLFTKKYNLPSEVAESFSYALCSRILRFADLNKILGDMAQTQEEFAEIDKEIEKALPKLYHELKKMNHGSFYFALKWQLILFADEHTYEDSFLIWDSIFVRMANFDTYRSDLIIAHLAQVEVDTECIMVEKIQKNKNWDTVELVNYAVKRYDHRYAPDYSGKYRVLFYVVLLIMALLYYFINGTESLTFPQFPDL